MIARTKLSAYELFIDSLSADDRSMLHTLSSARIDADKRARHAETYGTCSADLAADRATTYAAYAQFHMDHGFVQEWMDEAIKEAAAIAPDPTPEPPTTNTQTFHLMATAPDGTRDCMAILHGIPDDTAFAGRMHATLTSERLAHYTRLSDTQLVVWEQDSTTARIFNPQTGETVVFLGWEFANDTPEPTPTCRGCYTPNIDYGFCPTCTARNDALTAELNAAIRADYATLPPMGGGAHTATEIDTYTFNDHHTRMEPVTREKDAIVRAIIANGRAAHLIVGDVANVQMCIPRNTERYEDLQAIMVAASALRSGYNPDVAAAAREECANDLAHAYHCCFETGEDNDYKQLQWTIEQARRILGADFDALNRSVIDGIGTIAAKMYANLYDNPTPPTKNDPTPPKKPTNRATSQKRDNERAERARVNTAYLENAAQRATMIAETLKDFGFTIVHTIDRDSTPVTTWTNEHATVKQTPYTIRIYNGHPNPAKLRRHGEAELINRVNYGWCQDGEATGYAAGIVAALLPLLETPDPLMEALDAMEQGEQSPTPEPKNLDEKIAIIQETTKMPGRYSVNDENNELRGFSKRADAVAFALQIVRKTHDRRELWTKPFYAVAVVVYNESGAITLNTFDRYGRELPGDVIAQETPALILTGGQPTMTGPWQDTSDPYSNLPAIGGGSQDADKTAEQRISEHMQDRFTAINAYFNADTDEARYEAEGEIDALAIETKTTIHIQLSTGGPGDGFKLTYDPETGDLESGKYYFADWWDYAERSLSDTEAEQVAEAYGIYVEPTGTR